MIAALFVESNGCYFGLPDVDPWDEKRDARKYGGPWPIVAHPPCERWCRLAKFVESQHGYAVGDDGGCFDYALRSVRKFGGVIEHPAWSLAWNRFDVAHPKSTNGWERDFLNPNEWVCEVAQSAYGHPAKKATWLLYVGKNPPAPMRWNRPGGEMVVGSYSVRVDGTIFRANGRRMKSGESSKTPREFRNALIELARNCGGAPV